MPTQKSTARLSKKPPLSPEELKQIDAYWRAANYLTACQLYLLDNPLLERPLCESDLKQTIVGHWGTCPGQNFIYTHLDRVIKRDDLDMIYLSGPGHGGNAMVAQDWLDGSYTEVYPNITQDKDGHFKFVVAEGVNEPGPIFTFGDTNMRTRFSCGAREFVNRWSEAGPTHHIAAATGHHIDTILKVAEIFNVPLDVITR